MPDAPKLPPNPPTLSGLFDSAGSSDQLTPMPDAQQRTLPSGPASPGAPLPASPGPQLVVIAPPAAPPQQATMPERAVQQAMRAPASLLTTLGGEVLEWAPPRLVRARFPVHEAWHNAYGVLAGGIVGAMFDAVTTMMAQAVDPNRQHAVLETSVRFFRSVRAGFVIVDANVLRAGRTTATIECIAWDTSNELCAKGSATVMFLG